MTASFIGATLRTVAAAAIVLSTVIAVRAAEPLADNAPIPDKIAPGTRLVIGDPQTQGPR